MRLRSPIQERNRRLIIVLSVLILVSLSLIVVVGYGVYYIGVRLFYVSPLYDAISMIVAVIGGSCISFFVTYSTNVVRVLRNREKNTNVTVNIDGTPVTVRNLTQDEAQEIAGRYIELHPKITTGEHDVAS